MNHNKNNDNQDLRLDSLLAASPLRASETFADQTMARLAAEEADSDARLDALLARRSVKTGDSFTDKTFARLALQPADERLDELLASQPVEAAPAFTPETIARIHHEKSGPTHRQRWLASVAGLAAAAAIAFVTLAPPVQPKAVAAKIETTSAADATTHKALALANGLSGADGLLDGETMELLAMLSDQSGI